VVPVRLFGKKETGGKVELLFLHPQKNADGNYLVLLKPFLEPGKKIVLPGNAVAIVEGKTAQGESIVHLDSSSDIVALLEQHGYMPLPPYIKRKGDAAAAFASQDKERYQTVYSQERGSIAAPTAGLHFTTPLMEKIKSKGITIAEVILHVGWGTFRPIIVEDVRQHQMLPEHYEISTQTSEAIAATLSRGGKIVAVGTTTVRALESAAASDEAFDKEKGNYRLTARTGETSIFIYPGFRFKVIDRMVTNFHLPHSTPLMMVSALSGREIMLRAYQEAIKERYRFYSYGDAMIIL
jgi:S-adenosylmethionine:tRNA ribosyltransferase-isomerase